MTDAALIENGYEPVVVAGKAPVASRWQSGTMTVGRIARDRAEHPEATSTGIRTGRVVAVDNDLIDPAHAKELTAAVTAVLGETPFARYGSKPEPLLVYRNEKPLDKITVRGIPPDAAANAKPQGVEILGRGQQFVACGIHPATGQPYRWADPDLFNPMCLGVDALPEVTPDQLRQCAEAIGDRLKALGYSKVRVSGDIGERKEPTQSAVTGEPATAACIDEILSCISPDVARDEWLTVCGGLQNAPVRDPAWDGFEIFDAWSRGEYHGGTQPGNYKGRDDCEKQWEIDQHKAAGGGDVPAFGALVNLARKHGYSGNARCTNAEAFPNFKQLAVGAELAAGDDETQANNPAVKVPPPISAADLAVRNFPPVSYVWDSFILRCLVNLLYGDGGIGKTLLAEHIAVAVAAGVSLFGYAIQQMPALLVLAEDDYGETKARLEDICRALGAELAQLPITLWCLPGWDVNIARIADDGTPAPGPFLEPLRAQLLKIGPCLLVLDTVSDIAALDEVKRLPVNTLCKVVLGGLCRDCGATVLVNAHPSKASMADGSGYAGSTAWNNAVRNRLTFERPDGQDKGPRRVLRVAKANYGSEAELELYQLGRTFVTADNAGQDPAQEREAVLSVVLDLVDRGVQVVRANGNGQKPADIAKAVQETHGLYVDGRRVLDHLNSLERGGRLAYANGGNAKRGQRAGFHRPREN